MQFLRCFIPSSDRCLRRTCVFKTGWTFERLQTKHYFVVDRPEAETYFGVVIGLNIWRADPLKAGIFLDCLKARKYFWVKRPKSTIFRGLIAEQENIVCLSAQRQKNVLGLSAQWLEYLGAESPEGRIFGG